MAKITFYNNFSEKNRVSKQLTNDYPVEGEFRGEVDIMTPTFICQFETYPKYNYCYIEDFNRYYFIDKIVAMRNNLYRFECGVDPLMTYKDDILKLRCIIARQEDSNYYNLYLPDNSFKAYVDPRVQTKVFPKGFTDTAEFVLAVAGSGPSKTKEVK